MTVRAILTAAALTLSSAATTLAAEPVVSIWYRGTPAGTPRQDELAVIRALGFTAITWPASQTKGLTALKALAAEVGLQVTVVDKAVPVTPASLLAPMTRCDLIVTPSNAALLSALAWRAVAHGARTIAFDSGAPQGAGLENPDRSLRPWVKEALSVARQFTSSPRLIEALRPGPGVIVVPESSPSLDVVLLDGDRSWVLIATNASADAAVATVRLPAGVPYAIWVNMLDASTLAMNGEAAGPRWSLKLPPGAARVYVIDKDPKF